MSSSAPSSGHPPLHLQLREARRRAGLTQAALAERAGCMQSAVSMMESGRWSAMARPTLEKVAQLLGVPLSGEVPEDGPEPCVRTADAAKLCPNADCPSNLPYLVGGDLLFLPGGAAGNDCYCLLCGEVLVAECASCGVRPLPFAACCGQCGQPFVTPPPERLSEFRTSLEERQRQARLLLSWREYREDARRA